MAVKPEATQSLIDSIQSEVSTEASPMLRFLIAHARTIAVGIVLFIVAIAGFWVYEWQTGKQSVVERQELGRILAVPKAEDRLNALESYVINAPSSMKNAAWFAIADAAGEVKKYPQAYAAWEQIARMGESTRVPGTLGMAQALVEQGKTKEALALLDGISGNLGNADVVNVNMRIVLLAETISDYKRAIAACDAVIGNPAIPSDMVFWEQKRSALQQKLAPVQ